MKAAISWFRVHVLSATSAPPKVGTRSGPLGPSARSRTVTSTVSLALPPPAVTVSRNVRTVVADTCGAVNVGPAVSAPVSVTAGAPPVWVQA